MPSEEAVVLVVGACGLDRLLVVPRYPEADVSTDIVMFLCSYVKLTWIFCCWLLNVVYTV